MLPSKTYFSMQCPLFESNFDTSGVVKLHRIAEFLQDAAGKHAAQLGFGWNDLDKNNCLWVLSKMKIRFDKPLTMDCGNFTLVTWPLKPTRFFAERCFVALDEGGEQIFAATTLWAVIDRNTRTIASDRLTELYNCDFDEAHCSVLPQFARIRRDDTFGFAYKKTVRRSDLDINGHVNNTNYINYAMDVLSPKERVCEAEVVFLKELLPQDQADIFCRRIQNIVEVVGERETPCFTARLVLA